MNRLRIYLRFSILAPLLCATVSVCIATRAPTSRAAVPPTYSIDFHAIGAGGQSLRGHCYRLSATMGQPATGYSSVDIYSLIAGYWQPAPPAATDEIFFNELEVC